MALVLAIDCSYSVDRSEFDLQREGLAGAFRHPAVLAAIRSGPNKRIAVSVLQWSQTDMQALAIPWRVLSDRASLDAFATELVAVPRQVLGGATSISAALVTSRNMLDELPYDTLRRTVDIVSDGINNRGGDPRPVRDALAASGITINGLAIRTEIFDLDMYFQRQIIAGPGSFVIPAEEYAYFAPAILRKLLREIRGPGLAGTDRNFRYPG